MTESSLRDWVPIRVYWNGGQAFVDWCHFGSLRFTAPFFDHTIEQALRSPFALLFRRRTPIQALVEWSKRSPGLEPAGFILHMSRCGSTLVSQMLASSAANIVVSEASAIDSILRASYQGRAAEQQGEGWLQGLLSAYGQRRFPDEQRLFLKLDCWHIRELAVLRRAFPRTPWCFLYRNPLEVMASQLRMPGAWAIPGTIEPAITGIPPEEIAGLALDEYCARTLASLLRAALDAQADSGGLYVNYSELPEAATGSILQHFGVSCSEPELEKMLNTARFDAKTPGLTFEKDSEAKRKQASDRTRGLVLRWLTPAYEELETVRRKRLSKSERIG